MIFVIGYLFQALIFPDHEIYLKAIIFAVLRAQRVHRRCDRLIFNFVQFLGQFVPPVLEILELLFQPFDVRVWAEHSDIMVSFDSELISQAFDLLLHSPVSPLQSTISRP